MSGLTEDGYKIKRFRELTNSVQQYLNDQNSGIKVEDTSNKVVNNIVNPLLLAIADSWELGGNLWNSFDLMSASGVALDRLGTIVGIKREGNSPSTGLVEFFQDSVGFVSEDTLIKTTEGLVLSGDEEITLDLSTAHSFTIDYSTGSVEAGSTYFISIGDDNFYYAAQAGDTLVDIYNSFTAQIITKGGYSVTNESNLLTVTLDTFENKSIKKRSDMEISSFSTLVNFRTQDVGSIAVLSGTEVSLDSNVTGNTSLSIPLNFDRGTTLETDTEYRKRLLKGKPTYGKSTYNAILYSVSNLEGVDSVNVDINNSIYTSANGVPPKAYEVIVEGGRPQDIANTIFDVGGAGIEYFGNTYLQVEGLKGGEYAVGFTRPVNLELSLKVVYKSYEEFSNLPVNANQLIAQALADEIETYNVNEDVIPTKLNDTVYRAVAGVGEVNISIAKKGSLDFTSDRLPVSSRERPTTTIFDIEVTRL